MARQRTRSMLGFSDKASRRSSGSIQKVDAAETAEEKARYKINTKADPSKAMNEAQPSTQAVLTDTTIESIRRLEHRDAEGNVITDPDLSNPTRPRMERPLDTIRSFEAAIDGSYNRRASFRAEPVNQPNFPGRRTNNFSGSQSQRRAPMDGGGYYGNRGSLSRPASYVENNLAPSNTYYNGRRFGPRTYSDPALYGHSANHGISPSHGHHQSFDTVGTISNGSHATDQWGNSTDPSSENSSIDKVQPATKPDLTEIHGFSGFGGAPHFQGPILEEHGQGAPVYGQPGYGQLYSPNTNGHKNDVNQLAPHVPRHDAPAPLPQAGGPRVPIKLGSAAGNNYISAPDEITEKRRSWIKKRFSRG